MAKTDLMPKTELAALVRRSDVLGAWQVMHCWGVIALAMAAFIVFPYWWVAIPAMLIIGSRQLGLAILMHDTAHGILFTSRRANDVMGQLLLAWPVGTDMLAYRHYHLKHHRHTQQDDDPDLGLSAPFPISRTSLLRKFLRDMSGLTALKLRAMQFAALFTQKGRADFPPRAIFGFIGVNALMAAGFAAFGHIEVYLLLWLLPLMSWFQWVLRVRNIAEHALASRGNDPLTQARTTRAGWLARIFVAPYFVNYHIEHHAYMFIPCYNLAKAHRIMRSKYAPQMLLSPSYLAVIKEVTTAKLKDA